MRTITQAMLALGFVGAMAVSTPATTKAQGVSIYGPGVEVDIGTRRGCGPDRYWNGYRCVGSGYYGPGTYGYGSYGRYDTRQNLGSGIYRGPNGQLACYRRGFTVQDGVCKPYRGY